MEQQVVIVKPATHVTPTEGLPVINGQTHNAFIQRLSTLVLGVMLVQVTALTAVNGAQKELVVDIADHAVSGLALLQLTVFTTTVVLLLILVTVLPLTQIIVFLQAHTPATAKHATHLLLE
jgi:hypothetical protein